VVGCSQQSWCLSLSLTYLPTRMLSRITP